MSSAVPIPISGLGNGPVEGLNDGQSVSVIPRTVRGLSLAMSFQAWAYPVAELPPIQLDQAGNIRQTDTTIAREFCGKIEELSQHTDIINALQSGKKPEQELVMAYRNEVNSLMNCYSEKVREEMRPILPISKPKSYLLKKGFWCDDKNLTALSWASMQSNLILVKMFLCEVVGRVDDLEMQSIEHALGGGRFIVNEVGYYLFASFLFRNIVVEAGKPDFHQNDILFHIRICYYSLCDYLSTNFHININNSKIPGALCQIFKQDKEYFQSNPFYDQVLIAIEKIKEDASSSATGAPALVVPPMRSVIGFNLS